MLDDKMTRLGHLVGVSVLCEENHVVTKVHVVDSAKVLRPTPHKTGHFGDDVLPSQSLGAVLKKLDLTQQKQTIQEQSRV